VAAKFNQRFFLFLVFFSLLFSRFSFTEPRGSGGGSSGNNGWSFSPWFSVPGGIGMFAWRGGDASFQFAQIGSQISQMSAWGKTFDANFGAALTASTNDALKTSFNSLQQQPNMAQLQKFQNELMAAQAAKQISLDPLKIAQVNNFVQQAQNFQKIGSMGFQDRAALKSVETINVESQKRSEFYQNINSKFPKLPEAQLQFRTAFSSPVGEKLHKLQEEVLNSTSQNSNANEVGTALKHSRQLWLADTYANRGDHIKAQIITNEVFNEHYADAAGYKSPYLDQAYVEYTRDHLMHTPGFKKFTGDLVKEHTGEIQQRNFNFLDKLSDENLKIELDKYFAGGVPQAAVVEFRKSLPQTLSDIATQDEVNSGATALGYQGNEKAALNKLYNSRTFEGASSDREINYAVSNLRSAEEILNSKIGGANIPQKIKSEAEKSLAVSSELAGKAEKSLAKGDLVAASLYAESSRKMALNSLLQATYAEATVTPFGSLANSADAATKRELTELSNLMKSSKSVLKNGSEITRVTQGAFFIPENNEEGRMLREGIKSVARSNHLLNSYADSIPAGAERDAYTANVRNLSQKLAESFSLADAMWAAQRETSRAFVRQMVPVANFTAGFAVGAAKGGYAALVLVGELAGAMGSALTTAVTQYPLQTLYDVNVAIEKVFYTPYGTILLDAVDRIASESYETLLHGNAFDRGQIVGRAGVEVVIAMFGAEAFEGVGLADMAGSTNAVLEGATARVLERSSVKYEVAKLSADGVISDSLKVGFTNFSEQTPELAAALLSQKAPIETLEKVAKFGAGEAASLKTIESIDSSMGASVINELSRASQTNIASQAADVVGASIKVPEADRVLFAQKLSKLSPATVEATELKDVTVYRSVRSADLAAGKYDPWTISPGNVASDHRYSKNGIGALYVSSKPETALAETEYYNSLEKLAGREPVASEIISKQLNMNKLLDLSDPVKVKEVLGIDSSVLQAKRVTELDYEFTQAIGERARSAGFNGVIFKSAHNDVGTNIVLFADEVGKPIIK
jgi:hypothetical protein